MGVGELHTLSCQPIDVGSRNLRLGIETLRVAIAHIVSKNDDDVWLLMLGFDSIIRGVGHSQRNDKQW